jgi:uncharacterized repeat protein (TIGR03803 family)
MVVTTIPKLHSANQNRRGIFQDWEDRSRKKSTTPAWRTVMENVLRKGALAAGKAGLLVAAAVVAIPLVLANHGSNGRIAFTVSVFPGNEHADPSSGLIADQRGNVYGTTDFGGAHRSGQLVSFRPGSQDAQVMHCFGGPGGDGEVPYGELLHSGRVFIGTTSAGGAQSRGTIYTVGSGGSDYHILHHFGATTNDGECPCWGVTAGPFAEMIYGVTWSGGIADHGTVFQVRADGADYRVLHHFTEAEYEGRNPSGPIAVGSDGALYGMTRSGGAAQHGTIYRVAPHNSGFAVLHTFEDDLQDGADPRGQLLVRDGFLYGATGGGGAYGLGTIFRLGEDGSGFRILHSFHGTDGAFPEIGLVEGRDGKLYGATAGGGDVNGTVFRLRPDGGGFRVIHVFSMAGEEGVLPSQPLGVASDGTLYGVAKEGPHGRGTVFSLSTLPPPEFKEKFLALAARIGRPK